MVHEPVRMLLRQSGLVLSGIACFCCVLGEVGNAEDRALTENSAKALGSPASLGFKPSSDPIFVTSDSLTLKSDARKFQYLKNVKVVQGDMTLLCDRLDGEYTENNQMKELVATGHVVITKGENIKAESNKAVYDAEREIFTLTENPQIAQEGSILEADIVKVFVRENRTLAQGTVRVKMIKSDNDKGKTKNPTASPIPTGTAAATPAKSPS